MKILMPLALGSVLLVAACSKTPEATTEPKKPLAEKPAVHNYQCESGLSVAATYPSTETTKVEYQGANYTMQVAVSASGARYVGDALEWWVKGSGTGSKAMLLAHEADGSSGKVIEQCKKS